MILTWTMMTIILKSTSKIEITPHIQLWFHLPIPSLKHLRGRKRKRLPLTPNCRDWETNSLTGLSAAEIYVERLRLSGRVKSHAETEGTAKYSATDAVTNSAVWSYSQLQPMIPQQQVQSRISHSNRTQPCASDQIWDTAEPTSGNTMASSYKSSSLCRVSVGSLVKQLEDIDDTTQKAWTLSNFKM